MPDLDAAHRLDEAEVGRVFREEYGRSVATLISVFGDIDVAEDAVQDAFAVALCEWPRTGLPPNPGGWIPLGRCTRLIARPGPPPSRKSRSASVGAMEAARSRELRSGC